MTLRCCVWHKYVETKDNLLRLPFVKTLGCPFCFVLNAPPLWRRMRNKLDAKLRSRGEGWSLHSNGDTLTHRMLAVE